MSCAGEKISSEADSKDICLKGIFIRTTKSLPIDTPCDLELVLSGASTNLSLAIKGRVIRQEPDGLGIKFGGIDLDSYWHLKNLLLYNAQDPEAIEKEFPVPGEESFTAFEEES